jgi:[lysine-biosynthesis-protein LysW]--L-2-aminoadipate ligase
MRVGVLCSRVRVEEKLLFEAMRQKGIDYEKIDDREVIFQLNDPTNCAVKFDIVLERSVNHSRAL